MEALAGIALAGNILQFIELGQSILSKSNAIKRSHDGVLQNHKDLKVIVADLEGSMSKLEYNKDDEGLGKLIERCKESGQDLKGMLEKVAGKSKKEQRFPSYRRALLAQYHEKDIEVLYKRFETLRQQIGVHIQILTRHDVAAFQRQHQNSSELLKECITSSRDAILARCSAPDLIPSEIIDELAELRKLCKEVLSTMQGQGAQHILLSSLAPPSHDEFLETFKFREMTDREESIPKALTKTYEWILEGPDDPHDLQDRSSQPHTEREKLQTELQAKLNELGIDIKTSSQLLDFKDVAEFPTASFQKWLAVGGGIFWIWGKPGCGKSTMMKAMITSATMKKRLKSLLSRWGGGKTLIAPFFFFRPGMDLQKSQLGFLRATLYEILSKRKSKIDQVFSPMEKSEAVARLKKRADSETSVWTMNELRRALRKWRKCDDSHLYLHIDGIDEVDCQPLELANLLKDLSALPSVKILTAGRFHPDFDFHQKLNIHELTEPDILRFVIDKLSHPKLQQVLDPGKRSKQLTEIIREIITAAQGVFQWVKIVIDLVMDGVRRVEPYEVLLSRLQEYPKELDDLYWFLYSTIQPRYEVNAAMWLILAFCANEGNSSLPKLTNYAMHIADEYDPRDPQWLAARSEKGKSGILNKARMQQQRMQAQCPHFLDFTGSGKFVKDIKFAHRTILDFLRKDNKIILNKLWERLEIQGLPHLIFAALQFLESGIRDSNYVASTLLSGLAERCNFSDASWFFNQLAPFIHAEWEKGDKSLRTVPTIKGWTTESRHETEARLSKLKGGILHLLILTRSWDTWGFGLLVKSTLALGLEPSECELLLVEYSLAQISHQEGPRLRRREVEALFPRGVPYDSDCLKRILELTRFTLRLIAHTYIVEGLLKIIQSLILLGANPNTICGGVAGDPDLSKISIKVLLNRVNSASWDRYSTVKRDFFRIEYQKSDSELYTLLEKKGAAEFTIPYEEHGEDPVEITLYD